jgi:choline dehydrogenase-like flavoprotein
MFEGAAGPPDYTAMSYPFSGEHHREVMLRYANQSQFGLMVSDLSRGSVSRRGRFVQIRYDLNREDTATFKRAIELLCELYWAAGAKVVYPPIAGIPEVRDGDLRRVREHDLRASELTLLAFHPLGTARADARAAHGVVDQDLKVRGTDNLYVADGSVVPSSIGVNPQITIMALATRLGFHLLDRPAPSEEPEPEAIARPRITRPHALTA